jgi:hypothetical protein
MGEMAFILFTQLSAKKVPRACANNHSDSCASLQDERAAEILFTDALTSRSFQS